MIRAALAIAASSFLVVPGGWAQTVVLSGKADITNGLERAETTTIELKDGKMTLSILNQSIQGAANALLRDKITRTFKSADEQEIQFHECTRSILFSLGSMAGDPKLAGGQLAGKKLIGRRDDAGWKFKLSKGKPSTAELNAIKQFSAFNLAVDALQNVYGDEPREVGKAWRPDLSALSRAWPDVSVTIDCRVDEVGDRAGELCAKITIGGLVAGKFGENNRVDVQFTGSIIRSLRDYVDLETDLSGSIRFRGALGKTDEHGGGNAATIEAPLTLKRTVKVPKRPDAPR